MVTAYVQKQSDGKQLPWISSSLTGDIYLTTGELDEAITESYNSGEYTTKAPDYKASIAVLPFKNYIGDEENEWLVEGQ